MKSGMTRREFVAVGATAALSGAMSQSEAQEGSSMKPNVLIIHGDQHRIDCLGAYGNPDIRTPHIDGLASEGVRFEHSFCPYPVCTPSRYSLLSGKYVYEHQGWSNHCTPCPGTETFPAVMRDAGYKTKAVGKMHFTPTYLDVGFEEMVLSEQNGPGRWDDDYHRDLMAKGLVDYIDLEDQERPWRGDARDVYWETFGALPSNLPDEMHSTTWAGDHAVETLESWDGGGNMLMVGFIKPHHPFDPPKKWADRYDPAALTLLPGWTSECLERDQALGKGYFPNEKLTEDALRRVMAYYYGAIEHIDAQVGRMVEALKRKGLYENTLIIYTSDHGEYMGCHHMLLKGNYMYDPLVKVPLIIRYPGGAQGGTVSDALVSNLDVAPTILKQVGCRVPDGMKGKDLATEHEGREVVFTEDRGGKHVMARTKTRKLIHVHPKKEAFLYDLEKDPAELNDVSGDAAYEADLTRLMEAVRAWRSLDDLPKTYLDEDAPVIDQPNVPDRKDDHREKIIAYYTEKMAEGI